MTLIVNLVAGPGAGKTTTAFKLCHELKTLGLEAVYVDEWVKCKAYKKEPIDQFEATSGQLALESKWYGLVDVVVTDSPIELSGVYDKKFNNSLATMKYIKEFKSRQTVDRLYVFVDRNKPYIEKGRYQTEAEAKELDLEIIEHLEHWLGVPYIRTKTSEVEPILDAINQYRKDLRLD